MSDDIKPSDGIIPTIGAAAGAYHGWKRNQSIGWAIGWGVMGSIAPVITVAIALAQGFNDPKKAKNPAIETPTRRALSPAPRGESIVDDWWAR